MMRSKDIARLAGVSIRTLRHYHQIGLLPEPPRQDNGYRSYGLPHLIRMLRIGQLTALGLSLSQLPPLLDGDAEMSADRLNALHDELTRQLADPDHSVVAGELGLRFDALGPGSDNAAILELADAYIEHLGPWMKEFDAVLSDSTNPEVTALLRVHAVDSTNEQQQKLLAEISGRLAHRR